MIIGFTGTRDGMSGEQYAKLALAFKKFKPTVFHHGCCVGADAEAHAMVRDMFPKCKIVGHPPLNKHNEAPVVCHEYRPRAGYLYRNHDIVDECKRLIATPKERSEVLRSGTWATIRYARRIHRSITVIKP